MHREPYGSILIKPCGAETRDTNYSVGLTTTALAEQALPTLVTHLKHGYLVAVSVGMVVLHLAKNTEYRIHGHARWLYDNRTN